VPYNLARPKKFSLTKFFLPPKFALTNISPVIVPETAPPAIGSRTAPVVALVGGPNVGKSVVFHRLTGAYAVVSNYPGTTVEVSRGRGRFCGIEAEVVDTPGLRSLLPLSDEERLTRRMLLDGTASLVVNVVDAKNIDRHLPLTLQIIETGAPVIVLLNMMDEAERVGLRIDLGALESELGVGVLPCVATRGSGIDELERRIHAHLR